MTALIFELMGAFNFGIGVYFWISDRSDINNWLFFLVLSVIMYMNASRYEEN